MAASTLIQEIPELNPEEFEVVLEELTNGISTIYCNCPKYGGPVVVKCTEDIQGNDIKMLTSSAEIHHLNSESGVFSEFCGEVQWRTNSSSIYGVVHKSSWMKNLSRMLDSMRTKNEKISWALRFRMTLDIGRGIKLMQDREINKWVEAPDVIIDTNIRAKLCFSECVEHFLTY
uniref:Uncharacterized protein n=1 Tax=Ciona savignyi TaxID=51511 RepID=H2ZGK7_CIOSA